MYKAKIEIGGYKVGDEVPEEKAIVWAGMYVESPVEKVGADAPTAAPADDESKDGDDAPASDDSMHDDYLNRNADVVKKAIRDDNLGKSTLNSLLKIETNEKKRKNIVDAIKSKINALN